MGGGGVAISREGLEQLPTADRDKEPLCCWRILAEGGLSGDEGVEGGEETA